MAAQRSAQRSALEPLVEPAHTSGGAAFVPVQCSPIADAIFDQLIYNTREDVRCIRQSIAQRYINAGAKVYYARTPRTPDDTFTLWLGDIPDYPLYNDKLEDKTEAFTALRPGGVGIFVSWTRVPIWGAICAAAAATRPEGTPMPCATIDAWHRKDHLKESIEHSGFGQDGITIYPRTVFISVDDLDRYAGLLWSFYGRAASVGWLRSDEEKWHEAVRIIGDELTKLECPDLLPQGPHHLRFEIEVAVVIKKLQPRFDLLSQPILRPQVTIRRSTDVKEEAEDK